VHVVVLRVRLACQPLVDQVVEQVGLQFLHCQCLQRHRFAEHRQRSEQDRQQQEFEAALAEEQRRNELEISRLQDQSLQIEVSNEVSFDFDSAALKPAFLPTLDKVANILQRYSRTTVTVIGFSISTCTPARRKSRATR